MTWRLIPYSEHDGATNMAADEAILEAHLAGLVPPTLRLYGFKPATLSIGYTQKLPDYVVERANQSGFTIVRRPTGGRAVLHLSDLTYSFIGTSTHAGEDPPFNFKPFLQTTITGAYKQICDGLIAALSQLGLQLETGELSIPYKHLHDCFQATTGSDLHFQGKKLIGSAQLRRKWAVLQHGSLLLNQDQTIMNKLLAADGENVTNDDRHANLFDLLNKQIDMPNLEAAFIHGFEAAFSTTLSKELLSDYELQLINQLKPKYQFEHSYSVRS